VTHFAINHRPTRGNKSPYNTAGLISKVFKEIVTQIAKNCSRRQPHSFEAPGTPANVRKLLIFPETRVITFLSLIVWVNLNSNLCMGSKIRIFSATKCVLAVQGHPPVDDFGTNRKRICNFLLVHHCDYDPILHRFWDTATYWLEIAYFSYPSHSAPPLTMFPLKFRGEVNNEETTVIGLSSSEDPTILAWVVFGMIPACDRRTERRNLW